MPAVPSAKRKIADAIGATSTFELAFNAIPSGANQLDSCDFVRGKINRLIESGEIAIGEFCGILGVSRVSYNRFMATDNGKDQGSQRDTYIAACQFFRGLELIGIKPPKKQKVVASTAKENNSAADISHVRLKGEDSDAVEVYDSCDEIRRKIAAHLRKPGVTRAQFCRDLLAQYHSDKRPSQVQSAQLTRFMGYKGADTGNTSCVFYAAYVFFEKLRLREGKPKSKHRQEMETIWGDKGGFNITRGHQRRYYCHGTSVPYQDQFGRVSFR